MYDLPAVTSAMIATAGGARVRTVSGLEAAWAGARAIGIAYTVRGAPGDNLALHRAMVEARPGEVIVAQVGDHRDAGHWGELMSLAAQCAGIRGLVMDGAIRDRAAITTLAFAVFHRGTDPRPTTKLVPGDLGVPILLRGILIEPGDLVCADLDGVAIIPRVVIQEVLDAAAKLALAEKLVAIRLAAGESTLAIYGLEDRHRPDPSQPTPPSPSSPRR